VNVEHGSLRVTSLPDTRNASGKPARTAALSAMEVLPIGVLLPADSPRLSGEDAGHTRALADSEATLPPILVHRSTMRVIDGMHRLRAALLRGRHTIPVRYFDGSEAEAFVLAVEANTMHGLALSVADRTAAAGRILDSHPHWSDRAISSVAGLSDKAVAVLRRSADEGGAAQEVRTGRDGRVRPLNSASARLRASQLIADNPTASLRDIAHRAGTSPGTVRDVKRRLTRGEHPVPLSQRPSPPVGRTPSPNSALVPIGGTDLAAGLARRSGSRTAGLETLRNDPSLRHSDTGRQLLRLLSVHLLPDEHRERLVRSVPEHCAGVVSAVARECAGAWDTFADQLDRREAYRDRAAQ